VIEQTERAFLNERLTFRLDVLAQEAISANDALFVKAVGCTIREVRVLRLIDDYPGITFIEICRATGLERSLASRIIRRLLALQLIRRDNDSKDARRFGLSTTDLGKRRRTEARALSDRLEVTLCAPLSAGERKQLNSLLDRLALWVRSAEYKQALAEHEAGGTQEKQSRRRRQASDR
jgi:DNA-binding MarR family transcriptional regulator